MNAMRLIAPLVAGALLIVMPAAQPAPDGSVFYVATNGNDTWSGTLPAPNDANTDGPFATLRRAQEAVRELKARGLSKPVTVAIRAGTYHLPRTIVFEPQDSGTARCPITYEAYRDENVVLSGGKPITGWKTDDGKVYYADLPQAREGKWQFRQLFVDGRREIQARYPNFDASDVLRKGWLYAQPYADFGMILSGVAKQGDFIEYEFNAPTKAAYLVWVAYATEIKPTGKQIGLKIDGRDVPLGDMPASGGWRKVIWRQVATVQLEAGKHLMRWERIPAPDRIVHFDAFVLTDSPDARPAGVRFPEPAEGEHQIVVQAESLNARTDGLGRHTIGFQTFICPGYAAERARYRIVCPKGTIKQSWAQAPLAEVHIFATWGWYNEIVRIVSADPGTSIITIEGTECKTPIWPGNRFFVANVFEELDQPGEWYLDAQKGRLYYWPRHGDPANSTVIAPLLDRIVDIRVDVEGEERVQHITLRGLTFTHTDYTPDHVAVRTAQDAAVMLENAWHCAVEDCKFTNIGGSAVRLHLDSRHNRIVGNEIAQAGGNGVLLTAARVSYGVLMTPGEQAARYAPIENLIAHNHIHHCGRIHKYVAGVHVDSRPRAMAHSPGNVIAHNWIHDMPRNGIFAFQNQGGNVYEYNRIENVMLESDDGGGIHICTGNMSVAASALRNNVIRDVFGPKVGMDGEVRRALGFGLYLDGSTSSCTLTNNLVCRTSTGAVFLHGGKDNLVENNILVNDAAWQLYVSNYTGKMSGNRFCRNIVVCTLPDARMAALRGFTDETFAEVDHDLFWRGGEPIEIDPFGPFEEWRKKGFDTHSLVADPLFVDAAKDDYRLRPGSPALELGFAPFDTEQAGPQR